MASETLSAPYGGWKSPITAELINRGAPARDFPTRVAGVTYWQESRPEENGRITIVARDGEGREWDLLPYPYSARSRVHEYGGRAWVVAKDSLYFVEQSDQRVHRLSLHAPYQPPTPVTPEMGDTRFGEPVFDAVRGRLLCVMERHLPGEAEPRNCLAAIALDGDDGADPVTIIASGADFYAAPTLDASGERLCWLCWNHPDMPWDGSELWRGEFAPDGTLVGATRVAGGRGEALFQPGWSPRGELCYVSDRRGWWNLHRLGVDGAECLLPMAADFAMPLWVLGMRTWGFLDADRIAALFTEQGSWRLGVLDTAQGTFNPIKTPYTQLSSLDCADGQALFSAGSASIPDDIAALDGGSGTLAVIKSSANPALDDYISHPRAITFPTGEGDSAHGFYYPPRNPDYRGPAGEKPPLVVTCHGGPTAATSTALNLKIQFWTSRGFALLDVNYRGSSGFGRAYREKLAGQWGVADVADAVAGVDYLVAQGLVDPDRVLIRGSSAGGFTVLAALAFTDAFRAGTSLYGIGDLETLARDTHKFESRYLDRLVGPYPEQRALYQQRSPINHIDKLRCPVIFLQGLEDRVVPPSQAEDMVAALNARKIPVAHIRFPDEGHGFRKAPNIKRALEAELVFHRRVLHIASDEKLPPIPIDNA